MRNKKIKAWAVVAKTKNGKNIIQQNFIDETIPPEGEDRMYYVYVICEGINTAKRYNKKELDGEWEIVPVEIKLLSPNKK